MAQIIKNRRGSLDRLSSATGSLQKGEILIATGSSKLTGVTNGQGLVFAAVESGSVVAANRVLQGAVAPIFSGSTYGTLMDGVPFYASSSNTLFLLGADGNDAIDLSGNISDFSSSVSASFASLSQSVASVTGDFSSSVATSFSASNASLNALSESVFGFGGLSSSFANSISHSNHIIGENSASVATTISNLSSSIATTDSASAAEIAALSASVASVTGDFSSSVATSFSASAANVTALSASIATTDSASAAFATSQLSSVSGAVATTISNLSSSLVTADSASAAFAASQLSSVSGAVATTISNVSGAFATSTSASNAAIASLSASVASVTGDFSSSVATSFSASAASQTSLSASIALTDNAQSDRLNVIEATYATTGSNTFIGTQVIKGSLYVTNDLIVQGSSSLQNITASAVSIGTNTVILNTATPAVRFGGVSVQDSGSGAGASGSLWWDSLNNRWVYEHPNTGGEGYNSAILIAGPKNTGSLGEESTLTAGKIMVAVGEDHIGDSIMEQSSSTIIVTGDLDVSGEISASTINGIGNVTAFSSSISASIASINNNLGGGGSLGGRVANLETISASYLEFTQSYYSDSASFDTRIGDVVGDLNTISGSVYTQFSASNANVTSISGAFATSTSASNAQITALSASVASVTGDFSSSVATSFSASAANVTALSASIVSDVNTLSQSFDARIVANDFLDSTYATTGSNVFKGDQVLTGSFDMTGTANFNNAVAVNDSNMNLTNSSSLNLTGGSSIYVAGVGVISGSIVGIGNVSAFSTSVDSRISASVAATTALSVSVTTFSTSVDSRLDTIETSLGGGGSLGTRVANLETISASYLDFTASYYTDSASFDTRISSSKAEYTSFSASAASDLNTLSSSIYQTDATQSNAITNNSSSFATSISASKAEYTSFSASAASELNSVSGAFETTTSASKAEYTSFSASLASELNSVSGAFATSTSASNAAIASLSASVASTTGDFSSSVDGRLDAIEVRYATTGSNTFVGNQHITGDVELTGSMYIKSGYDLNVNHIVGNNGSIEIGNIDNNLHIHADNAVKLYGSGSGVIVESNFAVGPNQNGIKFDVSESISHFYNELSASNLTGIGNVSAYSQSVDSRLQSLVVFENSASTALSFDGANLTVLGNLKVNGSTTQVDSTIVNIGDNIISLNGTGGMFGGLVVKDPTSPNTASGSLLWDTTNDYWIAGTQNSESKVLVAVGDNVVSSSGQINIYETQNFVFFDTAISTSFSASNASIASLSASVSSVTGEFSSSVATSFSASNASIASLSASVASVTGDFSSSVATSFSASAFNLNELSASIYLTDATQSTDITNNSSSFATSISASNFRITVLETTIDGGSF